MNECMAGNHKCEGKTTNCKNNFGSYSCECKDGFELGLSPYKCNGKMNIYFFYYSSLGHSELKHSLADLNSSFIKRLLNVILSSCPIRINWLRLPTFGRFFFSFVYAGYKRRRIHIWENWGKSSKHHIKIWKIGDQVVSPQLLKGEKSSFD